MKTMFIVYHDIKTEARTQEILDLALKFGETYFVSYSKADKLDERHNLITKKKNYFRFILKAVGSLYKHKPGVVILHDNYCSILLPILKILFKSTLIIYDSSELYIDQKITSFRTRIFRFANYFERKYLKLADVVIAANIERAKIMKEHFSLDQVPLVFDNLHIIKDEYDLDKCDKKYSKYFNECQFTIVYAGGIAENRKTYDLVDSVGSLGHKYNLIIAGSATKDDVAKLKKILQIKKIKNVVYVGFISRDELKFLFYKAKVSVSAFSQDTLNNTYCASGKLYESIFENTPVLTTENPPLKRLCEDYGIGISTSNFKEGILQIEKKYNEFQENIKRYKVNLNTDTRIDKLYESIMKRIESNE